MKLWEPRIFCFCFDRRIGCIIIAVLYLVFGFINIAFSSAALSTVHSEKYYESCKNQYGDIDADCMDSRKKALFGGYIVGLLVAALQALFSSLLLFGVLKQNTRLFLPFLVMSLIQAVSASILGLMLFGLFLYLALWISAIISIVVFSGSIFLHVYCLLVVRIYYLNINRSQGQKGIPLNKEGHGQGYEQRPPFDDFNQPLNA